MRLLPTLIFEAPEAGLRVELSPEGDTIVRADPAGSQIVPERAVALAFDLLGVYAPEVLDELARVVRSPRLRLVAGSSGPEVA